MYTINNKILFSFLELNFKIKNKKTYKILYVFFLQIILSNLSLSNDNMYIDNNKI